MTNMIKAWYGSKPTTCNHCKEPLKDRFYDTNVAQTGTWGILCEGCFNETGSRIGMGLGQRYEQSVSGLWLKTGG